MTWGNTVKPATAKAEAHRVRAASSAMRRGLRLSTRRGITGRNRRAGGSVSIRAPRLRRVHIRG